MNGHARTAQPSAGQTPFDTLTEALGGLLVGHCLASVTNFKVADALGDTPRTAAELAADTGTDPEALCRMLAVTTRLYVSSVLPLKTSDRRRQGGHHSRTPLMRTGVRVT